MVAILGWVGVAARRVGAVAVEEVRNPGSDSRIPAVMALGR